MLIGFATIALLAGLATARHCKNLTIPITATARNGVFNISEPANNIDVTNFILLNTRQGTNLSAELLHGYKTVTGRYNISATYCEPNSGPSKVLQILTHGIGFDKTYWDPAFNNYNYSYVEEFVDQRGYSTFAWDRLGIAQSSHGDPINEIQVYLEVDALRFLTQGLRAGNIKGISQKYNTITHVGHSLGSQHSYLLTAMHPGISDGLILTGFSQNGSFPSFFALGGGFIKANNVERFKDYADGYIANKDRWGLQTDFFAPGDDFDHKILPYAFSIGYPVTIGEFLTSGGETAVPNNFAGPVLIITGEHDLPFCGGNCLAAPTGFSSIPATSKKNLAKANPFKVTIVPGAGHGLNFLYSAHSTYNQIYKFLAQNSLGPTGS